MFQDVPRYLREWTVTLFLLERMQQDEAHHLWFIAERMWTFLKLRIFDGPLASTFFSPSIDHFTE
jgi:hypothetical protein